MDKQKNWFSEVLPRKTIDGKVSNRGKYTTETKEPRTKVEKTFDTHNVDKLIMIDSYKYKNVIFQKLTCLMCVQV